MQPEAGWDTFVAQLDLMQEDWLENLDIRSSKTWAEQGQYSTCVLGCLQCGLCREFREWQELPGSMVL